MSVRRFDASPMGKVERTAAGFLRIPATPTRIGVLEYEQEDGSVRREHRPPEEVFAPEHLASFVGAAATDLHPPESVNASNWRQYAVGHVESAAAGETHVKASIIVADANEIRRIEAGERGELSCGYECEIEETPGEFEGQPYDVIQRQLRINHVAIGLPHDWGRAGPTARLLLDAKGHQRVTRCDAAKGTDMKKITIDGIEYEVGSDAHLQAEAKRAERLTKEAAAAQARADASDKAAAEAKAAADKAAKELATATDPKTLAKRAAERADVLTRYRLAMQRADKAPDAAAEQTGTDVDLMKAALETANPALDLAGKSEEFIRGAFWSVFANLSGVSPGDDPAELPEENPMLGADPLDSDTDDAPEPTRDSLADVRRTVKGARPTARTPRVDRAYDVETAQREMRERHAKAHEQPLSMSRK